MAVLSWNPVTNVAVTGYRVYYGRASRAYVQPLGGGIATDLSATFTATGLQRGVTHYFAVTAHDAQGNESAFSNEVAKVIQ